MRRWHAHYHTAGTGPIYQGRFKSFPIELDEHFLTVCRYVERNALRANLVRQAQNWRWSSLWHREHNTQVPWLVEWSMPLWQQRTAVVLGLESTLRPRGRPRKEDSKKET